MLVLILLLILVFLLSLLLWMPIQLQINSYANCYQILWGGILRINMVPKNEKLYVHVWVLGWRKTYDLLQVLHQRKTKRITQKADRISTAKKNKRGMSWSQLRKLIRTFKVKRWKFDLDTDDVIWNAYLFPLCYFLNRAGWSIKVNYEGRVDVDLLVENRPVWIVKSLVL